jgi:hypothetical protein
MHQVLSGNNLVGIDVVAEFVDLALNNHTLRFSDFGFGHVSYFVFRFSLSSKRQTINETP